MIFIAGLLFFILAFYLPSHLEELSGHVSVDVSPNISSNGENIHVGQSVRTSFIPGFQSLGEALTSIITYNSLLFSVIIVLFTTFFKEDLLRSRLQYKTPIIFSAFTLLTFSVGIVWSLFVSLIRPLTGTAPSSNDIYLSLTIFILGLSFTMFTICGMLENISPTITNIVIWLIKVSRRCLEGSINYFCIYIIINKHELC